MAKSRTSKTALPNAKPSSKPTPTRVTRSQRTPMSTRANVRPVPRSGPSGAPSKQNACLALLTRPNGATIEDLQSATGWQTHSIRGFLAGAVKKKLGLTLVSSKANGEVRRYRVVDAEA
jgi:hypothetical protein